MNTSFLCLLTAKENVSPIEGTVSNATIDTQGLGGNASVHINGADNSYVSFGTQIGQFGTNDFTVAFWVQTTESYRLFDLAGNRTAGSHGNFFCIRMTGKHESRPAGMISAEVDQDQNGTNYIGVESKTAGFNDGKWHHIAVVRKGASLTLYIDGVVSGNTTGKGVANIANGHPFKLGRSLVGVHNKFAADARYSGLRVYDTALNDSDISNLFSGITSPPNNQTEVKTKQIIDLYNTGVDNDRNLLGDSVADAHYQLETSPAGTVTPAVTTPTKTLASAWVANTATSRWIGPNSPAANGPVGNYIYKTTFTLPEFSEASIVGELSADDKITDILINGVSAGNPTPLGSWTTVSKFTISSGFVVGTNTIEFKISNAGGPTGLRIHSITGTYTPVLKVVGQIVVNADEWTISDQGIKNAPDGATFALNVAKYFVGENKGKFHVLSNNFGLTGASLQQIMTQAGHTWTKGMNIPINLETLQKYDGIFVGGDPVNNQVLIEYVKNGGKVYLCAGTGQGGAQVEANNWNTFLDAFGLNFQGTYNGIGGNIAVNNPNHPLFAGVKTLYQNNGNSITDLQPDSPLNQIIFTHSNGQGLIATAEFIPIPAPEPTPEATPEATPEPTPETPVSESEEFTITATQDVTISHLTHKGQVKRTQSDEYIEISNSGNSPADISGWKITSAGSPKQVFSFPAGTILEGGKSFRVYTNEVHPETGGFSFGSGSAIWNDAGDEAKLFDAAGNNVSTLAYGKNTVAGIKQELKVPQLKFVATHAAINKQMSLGGKVTFTEALSSAIRSFLEDDSNIESPLGLILNDPGSFDLPNDVTKAVATEKLRSYLNEGGVLTLYPTAKRSTAENGENVNENWIFELSLGAMSGTIFWAIVPRSGDPKVYNYGFS
jgi:hypothetical protein